MELECGGGAGSGTEDLEGPYAQLLGGEEGGWEEGGERIEEGGWGDSDGGVEKGGSEKKGRGQEESGVYALAGNGGVKKKKTRVSWLLTFAEADNARRFVRRWHRRVVPLAGHVDETRATAEIVW